MRNCSASTSGGCIIDNHLFDVLLWYQYTSNNLVFEFLAALVLLLCVLTARKRSTVATCGVTFSSSTSTSMLVLVRTLSTITSMCFGTSKTSSSSTSTCSYASSSRDAWY